MKLTYTDYLELPAPLPVTRVLLENPETWSEALGLERLGELWRHGPELYQLARSADSSSELRWSATSATGLGPQADLALSLSDAVVSTHATIRVTVYLPGPKLPWRAALARQALRTATRAAAARLAALLQDLTLVPAAVSAVAVDAAGNELAGSELEDGGGLCLPTAPPVQIGLAEQLQSRYPQTVEHFLAMDALNYLEQISRLEHGWERMLRGEYDPALHEVVPALPRAAVRRPARPTTDGKQPSSLDYDLIYAGGGLSLFHAAVMAAGHGRRVMVFDRDDVGCAHREWNISRDELQALVLTGVLGQADLDQVVMREYRDGVVRFYSRGGSDVEGTNLWMPEVLNVALDAGALLRLMRRKLEAAGGTILSRRAFRRVRVTATGPMAVEVELEHLATGVMEHYTARLLLDGMGSTSPLALLRHAGQPFAGVCPTVGTVAAGFAQGDGPLEVDLSLGEILLTVSDAQRGEQLMWEGFPGRNDELTVYLFYYSTLATAGARRPAGWPWADTPRHSLFDLFELYFTLLPTYKRPGPHFRHKKPVFGYIPGRHTLRAHRAPLLRGVLPVGDSAAQQSPLTFCGFGAHIRNLRRTTGLLAYALAHDLLEPAPLAAVNAQQTNTSLNWIFSRFMHPWGGADDVNRLQNLFLGVLNDLGVERATRFYRDQMRWSDCNLMLLILFQRWPQIVGAAWRVIGPRGLAEWAGDYAHFTAVAAGATLARLGGTVAEQALTALADRRGPALGLHVRAWYEELRAMGWVQARAR